MAMSDTCKQGVMSSFYLSSCSCRAHHQGNLKNGCQTHHLLHFSIHSVWPHNSDFGSIFIHQSKDKRAYRQHRLLDLVLRNEVTISKAYS